MKHSTPDKRGNGFNRCITKFAVTSDNMTFRPPRIGTNALFLDWVMMVMYKRPILLDLKKKEREYAN
ncbi:hypothetical protein DX926_18155 [Bacillus atrophaeus]|nr:hypothetical protein DX926_18155 [Bacillus atrophaeus]